MIFHDVKIKLIAYDFDGVMTDNKALISPSGEEAVFVNRSDGLAIKKIKALGIEQIIISSETNPIVLKRAEKLKIPALHSVEDKLLALEKIISEKKTSIDNVIFVGNDLNDFEVMTNAGLSIAPKGSHKKILEIADIICDVNGGEGIIMDIYNRIVEGKDD